MSDTFNGGVKGWVQGYNPIGKGGISRPKTNPRILMQALQAMQQSGGGGVSSGGGGGGNPTAIPSTLAGLPQGPILDDLLKRGLIREGMPPEQALALIQLAQLRGGVGVDVKALMDQINATYASTTGDILGAGQTFMENMYGLNFDPNDPNAALFMQDPTFASYAGGLAQMDETSDMNQATDIAWFLKAQEAQQAYYDQMMAGISTGTIPLGGGGSGGGGGGGGGYGGRRGYGGGGSGGDSDLDSGLWEETDTRARQSETLQARANENISFNWPGWAQAVLGEVPSDNEAPRDPEYVSTVSPIWNQNQSPESFEAAAQQELDRLLSEIDASNLVNEGNTAWEAGADEFLNLVLQRARNRTGMGDNPETEEVEWDWVDPEASTLNTNPVILTPQMQALQELEDQLFQAANDPSMAPYSEADQPGATSIAERLFGSPPETINQSELNEMGVDVPPPEMGGPTVIPDADPYVYMDPEDRPQLIPTGPDGESFVAMDANGAILPDVQHTVDLNGQQQGTSDEEILRAVAAARLATDPTDSQSNNYYWGTDEFRQADPEVQWAIVQSLADEGVPIPRMAWTLGIPINYENNTWTDVGGNVIGISETEDSPIHYGEGYEPPFEQQQQPEQPRDFSIGGMFSSLPFVTDEMGEIINRKGADFFNNFVDIHNSPVNPHTGELRPDLRSMLENYSLQQMRADQAAAGGGEFFTPQPGDYWNPDITPEEEIDEMERQYMYIAQALEESRNLNPNYSPNPYRETLNTTGTELSSLTNTTDANSPNDTVVDLVGVGDPEYADPYELDPIIGSSYGDMFMPMESLVQPMVQRATNKTGRSFAKDTGRSSYKKPASTGSKAASNLSAALSSYKKKKGGKSFGKYG